MSQTDLMRAAEKGDVDDVRRYIDQAGEKGEDGQTALMYAAEKGNFECAELLIEKEAGLQDSNGWTAMQCAAYSNCPQFIPSLLATEAKMRNNDTWTALMWAAYRGYEDCARLLLCEAGMQSTERWEDFPAGVTALMIAAWRNHESIVDLLKPYEQGLQDNKEHTAYWYAQNSGSRDGMRVRLLLQNEGTLRVPAPDGVIGSLINAAIAGDISMAREYFAEAGQRDASGQTALMKTARYGHAGVARLLREHEAGLYDNSNQTALDLALDNGYYDVALLLECEHNDETDITMLMISAGAGSIDDVNRHLSEAGLRDHDGWSALMYAAEAGYSDCVLPLLKRETGLQASGEQYGYPAGTSALILAASNGHTACTELLADHESGLVDGSGKTALIYAASSGYTDVVRLLCGREACLRDNGGWTALMHAAYAGEIGCVRLLLNEIDVLNDRNETALDIAESVDPKSPCFKRCVRCARVLREHLETRDARTSKHITGVISEIHNVRGSLAKTFTDDEVQDAERDIALVIETLENLKWKAEQRERDGFFQEVATLRKRLETVEAANRELTARLDEKDEEIRALMRLPHPITSSDGYTLEDLEKLKENLTVSLQTATVALAIIQTNACIVCLGAQKNVLLHPCRHLCVCETCAASMRGQQCPLCRSVIENTERIYLL